MADWRKDVCAESAVSDMQPRPDWVGVVPYCDTGCQFYDGKRCGLIGVRPSQLCEPVVVQMGVKLNEVRRGD